MHGDAQRFAIAVQHFNINHGFEHPLLDTAFPPHSRADRYRVRMPGHDVVFYFYVTRGPRTIGPNRSLLRVDNAHPWFGEMVVLRRAKYFDGFVNFRHGDTYLARRAASM